MRHGPIWDVEQRQRVSVSVLAGGLAVFLAAALVVAVDVKTYELQRETKALEAELEDLEDQIARARVEEDRSLQDQARSLGYGPPTAEQTVVLYLR